MSRHLIVLGAGISGLATGWFLKKKYPHFKLSILEKSSRVGGWIQTIEKEGFLFEQGPHSCRVQGTGHFTLELIEDLKLKSEVIFPSPEAKQRFIYYQKKLCPFPKGIKQILFSPLTKGWLKALIRDWQAAAREKNDESIASFFSRRLGKEWVERLIDPLTLGIYAGDCQNLSLKSCFPRLDEWEKKGSLLKGAWSSKSSPSSNPWIQSFDKKDLFSFKHGMQTLPLALASYLKEHLYLNQEVRSIQGSKVFLASGECLIADKIISTLSFPVLANLLNAYPDLKQIIKELSYTSVTNVSLGFDEKLPLKGFGYLVPSKEGIPFLGCLWDSSVFPQQNLANQTRLTVLLGGQKHLEVNKWSPKHSIDYSLAILQKQLGIVLKPKTVHCQAALQAIAQYKVGYAQWKERLDISLKKAAVPWILSGSALSGVSINDCIAQASSLKINF